MLAKIVSCYDSNSWYKDCIGRIVELQDGLGSACYNTQTGRTSLSTSHASDMFPWAFDKTCPHTRDFSHELGHV